jgi:ribonuclease P protein component
VENKGLNTLRRNSDFERLKREGLRVRPTKWMLISYLSNELGYSRVGWTISGKVANSVVRNRLKRWSRDFFREAFSESNSSFDLNVVLRADSYAFYKNLESNEYKSALAAAWIKISKNT